MIQPPKNHEYKKVSGQILDPFKDVNGKNNVFNNLDIADTVAKTEKKAFNLAYQHRLHVANHRSDKEIKSSLKEIN